MVFELLFLIFGAGFELSQSFMRNHSAKCTCLFELNGIRWPTWSLNYHEPLGRPSEVFSISDVWAFLMWRLKQMLASDKISETYIRRKFCLRFNLLCLMFKHVFICFALCTHRFFRCFLCVFFCACSFTFFSSSNFQQKIGTQWKKKKIHEPIDLSQIIWFVIFFLSLTFVDFGNKVIMKIPPTHQKNALTPRDISSNIIFLYCALSLSFFFSVSLEKRLEKNRQNTWVNRSIYISNQFQLYSNYIRHLIPQSVSLKMIFTLVNCTFHSFWVCHASLRLFLYKKRTNRFVYLSKLTNPIHRWA